MYELSQYICIYNFFFLIQYVTHPNFGTGLTPCISTLCFYVPSPSRALYEQKERIHAALLQLIFRVYEFTILIIKNRF